MGNVVQCMAGKLVLARVKLPNGNIVDYEYSVPVVLLMTLHPGYLVVQCSLDPLPPDERREIKVMDEDDRLRRGQSYMMYPIPPQYQESFSFRFSTLRDDQETLQGEGRRQAASGYKEGNGHEEGNGHKDQKAEIWEAERH